MQDFWDHHGLLFIVCMFFFPRLTLLFATVWGSVLWWLGWIFVPRVLAAVLATVMYWESNPLLVILAWVWALCLEPAEKGGVKKSVSRKRRQREA